MAGIFGLFAVFYLSYSTFVLGALNGWFGLDDETTTRSLVTFLICWLVAFAALTLVSLRLPTAFTVLFALVVVALAVVLATP